MKMEKIFNVYPETSSEIKAIATFNEDLEVTGVRLLSKISRGQYYSVLNDAMQEAQSLKPCFN